MRILIVTDAWLPQINGVVRTLELVGRELTTLGHHVEVIGPGPFRTIPLPTYPEIRIAIGGGRKLARMIEASKADAIHIATEGSLGWLARNHCVTRGFGFTTSFHTRFPEYLAERFPFPKSWSYAILRRFHAPSAAVMVATPSIEAELQARGFANLQRWSRGVDTELFRPRDKSFLPDPRPISLYVGRVAVEKNLEAFLSLPSPGTKYIVGDGPQLAELRRRYPETRFTGPKEGEELARYYAAADVFVFPSKTDTFGLVLLEALAAGVPVAAYPVPGPIDILGASDAACLDEDLGRALECALALSPERCRSFAMNFSWQASAQQFLNNLHPFR